jgi:chromate transporter
MSLSWADGMGVIVSLALYLAGPVLRPASGIDAAAVTILLASLVLLARGWGVLRLIAAAALVGLGRSVAMTTVG